MARGKDNFIVNYLLFHLRCSRFSFEFSWDLRKLRPTNNTDNILILNGKKLKLCLHALRYKKFGQNGPSPMFLLDNQHKSPTSKKHQTDQTKQIPRLEHKRRPDAKHPQINNRYQSRIRKCKNILNRIVYFVSYAAVTGYLGQKEDEEED